MTLFMSYSIVKYDIKYVKTVQLIRHTFTGYDIIYVVFHRKVRHTVCGVCTVNKTYVHWTSQYVWHTLCHILS
jgi:hypothetical protein